MKQTKVFACAHFYDKLRVIKIDIWLSIQNILLIRVWRQVGRQLTDSGNIPDIQIENKSKTYRDAFGNSYKKYNGEFVYETYSWKSSTFTGAYKVE